MTRLENLNDNLRHWNYPFRAVRALGTVIAEDAIFVAIVPGGQLGHVLIDSNLERYLKGGDGRFYLCTNFDLMALKEYDREALIIELSGQPIF